MLDLLPDRLPAKQSWLQINPAKGRRRARVALLTGCAQSVLAPDINTATIEVLTHCGVEVVVPQKQVCCGALSWHVGNLAQAQSCAKANVRAFPNDVDAIVTNAAGCGSGMREYHLILKGTEFESQANEFCNRLFDVSAFLDRLGGLPSIPDSGFKKRVAYHDACHLSNSQNVTLAPRRLLQSIPGIEICEIAEPHLCCGSAGTYNIDQPSIARKMGQEKAANIQSLTPDLVATGNIGCMTQLSTHLAKLGTDVPVKHTMQVLRDAYRGCAL
jgi:glycolate oxidase iron-sulfur subunit